MTVIEFTNQKIRQKKISYSSNKPQPTPPLTTPIKRIKLETKPCNHKLSYPGALGPGWGLAWQVKRDARKSSQHVAKQIQKAEKKSQLAVTEQAKGENRAFVLAWKVNGRRNGKKEQSIVVDQEGSKKQRWHLTDNSLIVAAIRRNLSNISTKDFGAMAMCDMHSSVLCKAEVLLGATRIAAFRTFHNLWETTIATNNPNHPNDDDEFDFDGLAHDRSLMSIAVHSFSPLAQSLFLVVWESESLVFQYFNGLRLIV